MAVDCKVLDLGCGRSKVPGALGIDSSVRSDADIIYDLNTFPYPFGDNTFDVIHCHGILEHLSNLSAVMEEIWRIAKPDARIDIVAPYFTSVDSFTDLTHKHFFSARSMDYLTGEFPEYGYYSTARFRKAKVEILFWRLPRLGGLRIQHLLGAHWLANRFTSIYERFFAYLFPAQMIVWELTVVKR